MLFHIIKNQEDQIKQHICIHFYLSWQPRERKTRVRLHTVKDRVQRPSCTLLWRTGRDPAWSEDTFPNSVDRCQHSIQTTFLLCNLMDCDEKQNLIVALLALCGCLLVIVLAIVAFVLRVKTAGIFLWENYFRLASSARRGHKGETMQSPSQVLKSRCNILSNTFPTDFSGVVWPKRREYIWIRKVKLRIQTNIKFIFKLCFLGRTRGRTMSQFEASDKETRCCFD